MKQKTTIFLLFLLSQLVFQSNIWSQSAVTAFNTTYISTTSSVTSYTNTPAPSSGTFASCSSTSYNYSFNNGATNALRLLSIIAGGRNYFVQNTSATIKLRRWDNAQVTGQRSIIFLEAIGSVSGCPTPNRFDFKSPYQDAMETFLNANYLNQGTDNIFTNASNSDGNNNNIERVDVIFPAGISTTSTIDAGFALFDRGVNNNHDGFRIAAITSLDGAGDPLTFGTLKTCVKGTGSANGSWGHPTIANGNIDLSVYVMRKEETESNLRSSAAINQQIGGVFFSFADLGISAGQTIYGYSLIGPDGTASPTNAQLLSISNSTVYPRNTTEAIGGGLDLIAINASFSTGAPTLPIKIISFAGQLVKNEAVINWKLEDASPGSKVMVERSADGVHFTPVMEKQIQGTASVDNYKEMVPGTNPCYRLKLTTGNDISYSQVTCLQQVKTNNLKIYPSFLRPGQSITIEGFADDRYKVSLISMDGWVVQKEIDAVSGKIVLPTSAALAKGIYNIRIEDKNRQQIASKKIILLKD